jgi:hypothetical protein
MYVSNSRPSPATTVIRLPEEIGMAAVGKVPRHRCGYHDRRHHQSDQAGRRHVLRLIRYRGVSMEDMPPREACGLRVACLPPAVRRVLEIVGLLVPLIIP